MMRPCSGRLAGVLAAAILMTSAAGCTKESTGASANGKASDHISKLKDPDAGVRAQAAESLRRMGREKAKAAIPDLIVMLGDSNERCRMYAGEALGTFGEDSYAPLMESIKSKDPKVRAVSWLAISGLEASVYHKHQAEYAKALDIALQDEDLMVRHHAASSFYRHNITAPDAYPVVVNALERLGENEDKKVLCYLLDGLRNLSEEEKKGIVNVMPTLRKLSQHNDTDVKGLATHLLLSLEKVQK